MKKRTDKRNILDDKRVVLVLSFVLGFLCWLIVAGFIFSSTDKTLSNVRIDYTHREESYKRQDLQIITDLQSIQQAAVRIEGDSSIISSFTSTDVTVYPDYADVNGPGTYDIPLRADKVKTGTYNIDAFSLSNSEHSLTNGKDTQIVTLTFEEVTTKTFPIVVYADDVTAASGYFKDTAQLSVTEATVTGPTTEIGRVSSVVARVDANEERDTSVTFPAVELQMEDANGEIVESDLLTIGPVETVEVTIPILEVRTLNLTVDIIGAQQGFDMEWLKNRITLSTTSIQVVGKPEALAKLQNPYSIKDFDISELDVGWESEEITITLPEGVKGQDSAKQITASFDSTGLVEKTFVIPKENLSVRNTPNNVTIIPTPESVTVTLIGPADQIDTLLPENIRIDVDAFNITASRGGQQNIPGRVVIPSVSQVFAVGSYPIVCDVEVD